MLQVLRTRGSTTETLQVHHGMNETTHDEENVSEDEDDISEENSVYEIESHLVNGEQKCTRRQTPSYQL